MVSPMVGCIIPSVNKTIFHRYSHGPSNLDGPSLRISAQVILGYDKLTIKANHDTSQIAQQLGTKHSTYESVRDISYSNCQSLGKGKKKPAERRLILNKFVENPESHITGEWR